MNPAGAGWRGSCVWGRQRGVDAPGLAWGPLPVGRVGKGAGEPGGSVPVHGGQTAGALAEIPRVKPT